MPGTRSGAATHNRLLSAIAADDAAAVRAALAEPSMAWACEGGCTALHLAAGFAGGEVMAALLEALAGGSSGAQEIDARLSTDLSNDWRHPLLSKERASRDTACAFRRGATPLHVAVFFGDAGGCQSGAGGGWGAGATASDGWQPA